MSDLTKISGNKTVKDWKVIREKLKQSPYDMNQWENAWDFFYHRIDSRYLEPIKRIKKEDKYLGEGFSIMAILCSLIEFLETTWTGEVYKYKKPNKMNFEYSNSKEKFISFLTQNPPFKDIFNKKLAREFYVNVRCGILHEAQTKKDWIIRIDNGEGKIFELRDGNKVID